MKKHVCKWLVALSAIVILATGSAIAQSQNPVMKVQVPFQFTAGNLTLPAGDYRLLRPHQSVVLLEDSAGRGLANIITNSAENHRAQADGKLVFRGYNGRYFLAEVWRAGAQNGQTLPISGVEREFARNHKPVLLALVVRR